MKRTVLSISFILVYCLTFAQISFNAKAGMNVSNFNKNEYKAKIGYKIGAGMEYTFTDIWAIQPSLFLSTKGAKEEIRYRESADDPGKEVTVTINEMYLELPIMAAARLSIADNMNMVITAGPYIAYGIAGKSKYDKELPGVKKSENTFRDNGYNRFDAGVCFGVAGEMSNIIVGLDSQFGLTKLHDRPRAPKNLSFSVILGYKF